MNPAQEEAQHRDLPLSEVSYPYSFLPLYSILNECSPINTD
jgi:hypothetical protein